jgi:hypothetical protein
MDDDIPILPYLGEKPSFQSARVKGELKLKSCVITAAL